MRITIFLKLMGVLTCMAVLYTHLQVKIYHLGYQGQARAQQIDRLAEKNSLVKNDILRLTSSTHIGRELLQKEDHYRFASRTNVIEVEEADAALTQGWSAAGSDSRINPFLTIAFAPAGGR